MPFYEYECASCKFYTEVMQKISDAPLEKCPSCGKKALKKLVSAPVFRLKGGGWYETDFKTDKEGKRNLAGSDRDDSGPASKSDDGKPSKATRASGAGAAAGGTSGGDSGGGSSSKDTAASSGAGSGKDKAASGSDSKSAGGSASSQSASRSQSKSRGKSAPPPAKSRPKAKAKAKPPARKKGRR